MVVACCQAWCSGLPGPVGSPGCQPAAEGEEEPGHHQDGRDAAEQPPGPAAASAPWMTLWLRGRGGRSMRPGSAGSRPSASAGRVSVPRSMARICSTVSGSGIAPPDEREHQERHDLGDGVGEDVEDELADVVVDPPALLDGRRRSVAKLSSVSTMVAASRATSVPHRPIATPMSARRSAGASLTPSPVIATTWPCARRASAMRSLASGELRAKTTSSVPREQVVELGARSSRRARRR